MKKVGFLVMLFFIGVVLAFAGGGADSGKQTINFWYWDQNCDPMYETTIAEFEKANPGIKVQKTLLPWDDYWTKLQTSLPTGTGPDVFWINHPNLSTYFPTGLLLDLEPAAADIGFQNFAPSYFVPFTANGKRYGIPITYDIIVLFYNKEIFDKAGVAYPNDTWTWADFQEAARKLTIRDGNKVVQYGCTASPDFQGGIANQIFQNGGKIFSDDKLKLVINSPESREAVQYHLDLIHKYRYAPTMQETSDLGGSDQLFMAGLAAMHISRNSALSWFVETMGQNVRIAPNPMQKQRASVLHSIAYVGSSKTKNADATRKFIAFLASKRHNELISTVWEPCFNGFAATFYSQFPWIDSKVITDSLTYAYPLPIANKNGGAVWTLMGEEMTKVYMNPQVGDQLANFERIINAEIAK